MGIPRPRPPGLAAPLRPYFRKGRTWAIAVERASYKSLFLLNSGRFSLEQKKGNSILGLPRKQKIAVNTCWVQESEIGEEC